MKFIAKKKCTGNKLFWTLLRFRQVLKTVFLWFS